MSMDSVDSTNKKNKQQECIVNLRRKLNTILKRLQWNEADVLKDFNSNSKLAAAAKLGQVNELVEPALPASCATRNSCVIDEHQLRALTGNSNAAIPQTFAELQLNFSREQKLLLYEHVRANTEKCLEPELTVPLHDNSGHSMTFAQIVAIKKRDSKQKQRRYRTTKPTHIEEVRNLVDLQMQALTQYLAPKKSVDETSSERSAYRRRSRSRDKRRRNSRHRGKSRDKRRTNSRSRSISRNKRRTNSRRRSTSRDVGHKRQTRYTRRSNSRRRSTSNDSGHKHSTKYDKRVKYNDRQRSRSRSHSRHRSHSKRETDAKRSGHYDREYISRHDDRKKYSESHRADTNGRCKEYDRRANDYETRRKAHDSRVQEYESRRSDSDKRRKDYDARRTEYDARKSDSNDKRKESDARRLGNTVRRSESDAKRKEYDKRRKEYEVPRRSKSRERREHSKRSHSRERNHRKNKSRSRERQKTGSKIRRLSDSSDSDYSTKRNCNKLSEKPTKENELICIIVDSESDFSC